MCEPGTCEDCCSTDEWIVPSGLTSTNRPRPATETRRNATQVSRTPRVVTAPQRRLERSGGTGASVTTTSEPDVTNPYERTEPAP